MSFPSGPQSPQLENNASPLSPIPTIYGLQSNLDHFVDDISDFEDSESDNDLSPILNAITVSSIPLFFEHGFKMFPFRARQSQYLRTQLMLKTS